MKLIGNDVRAMELYEVWSGPQLISSITQFMFGIMQFTCDVMQFIFVVMKRKYNVMQFISSNQYVSYAITLLYNYI